MKIGLNKKQPEQIYYLLSSKDGTKNHPRHNYSVLFESRNNNLQQRVDSSVLITKNSEQKTITQKHDKRFYRQKKSYHIVDTHIQKIRRQIN